MVCQKPKRFYLLETLDLRSLSANISNNEEIKGIEEAYNKHPNKKSVTT